MVISEKYNLKCCEPSDINEHIPTLYNYALECSHITECGVRTVVSSYAFAHAKPKKLIQIDPVKTPECSAFIEECSAENIECVFYEENNLECPMEQTDLLFIDTWHVYGQLKRELALWNSYVTKYIIMHDTTVDEWTGELVRCGGDSVEQSLESGIPELEIRMGLWPAIVEFLSNHPEWRLKERFTNNNGLTILERIV